MKRYCRETEIEKLEVGSKGAVISLRDNRFANPAGLVELIQRNAGTLKVRPDQKILYQRNWDDAKTRLAGVAKLVQALAKIARTSILDADAAAPPNPTPARVKPNVARRA
jgi:transcription-repair coupling factor (superfamily II helicase)